MVPNTTPDSVFLTEEAFVRRLHLEQRRTERSRRPFVFVLLEVESAKGGEKAALCERIAEALATAIRETDIRGWYEKGTAIGVIFTEIGLSLSASIGNSLVGKIRGLLESKLTVPEMKQVALSFYVFPEDW